MVLLKTLGCVSAFLTVTSPLMAQDATRHSLFEQPVGGVYTQGWWAVELGQIHYESFEVYVIGEGKLGDFFGVLSVDCINPQFSTWRAMGGYLGTDDVPLEAINGIRNLACDRPS